MTRKLFPIFRFQSNITEIGAVQSKTQIYQKIYIFMSVTVTIAHIYAPFFLVEFRFVASFLVYNIDLSTFIFDSIQSAKKQRMHD